MCGVEEIEARLARLCEQLHAELAALRDELIAEGRTEEEVTLAIVTVCRRTIGALVG